MPRSPKVAQKEVGPGRPPQHSQFKPGTSGNPKGRPPKKRDLKKLVEEELDLPVWITENGKRVRLTKREIIVKTLVNDAAKGDPKALATLVKLIGTAGEEENPYGAADEAEIAAFVARYLPSATGGSND